MSMDNPPMLRMIYQTRPDVIDSDYDSNTIVFGASYYKHGSYDYAYIRRAVDARDYAEYRIQSGIERRQHDFKKQSLQKRQLDKGGGLVNLRIPIKSKTVESLFGEGGAGIKVSGYHRINFSGRSTWTDQAITSTYRHSKFPSLNMEQESRFDISGTIGTKISVSVSHDSKTDIPLANRIMLRYKGDEDDIIKTIEAGNTTLSLPNTQFVGYSSRINGLFGIKSTAQIGALELTAIASQEKGTTERTSLSAGASASKSNIRDYNFVQGRIYDLGRLRNLRGITYDTYDFQPGDSIIYIEMYRAIKSYTTVPEVGSRLAYLYVDPLHDTAYYSQVEVVPIDGEYYVQAREHWILFEQAFGGSQGEIAAYMIVKRAGGTIDTVGSVTASGDDPLRLKLIADKSPSPDKPTWNYMWRNVYYLMQTNIDLDGLEINVYKGGAGTENTGDNVDHQDGVRYINILGLDRLDQSGNAKPDGLVDVKTSLVDDSRGLLIFPHRLPFAADTSWASDSLSLKVPELYSSSPGSRVPIEKSAYYIEVSNKSRSSEIRLGKANIIEGSERITLNGAELQKGVDYNINYDFGQVTFLSADALDPNADLNIDFEYAPYISAEKKTLFGIRGEYSFSNDLKVGSTFLYKSDKATARKPKVGQETAKSIVWDADISYKTKTNFLTTLADALPLYSTETPSNLAFSAEFAQSIPNPNVDGVAYIDDFEGARDAYSLGVFRETWSYSSRPASLDATNRRARLVWYNPYDQVLTTEIWNRDEPTSGSRTNVLALEYRPAIKDRRIADANEDTTVSVSNFPELSWAGIIRNLSVGAANQEEAQLLEVRLKGMQGVLHFEFGEISEDIDGNGVLTTEDTKGINDQYDGILSSEEDVGLDKVHDTLETNELGPYDPVTNPDPHGDNWYYNGVGKDCNGCNEYDYSHINGTEGNYLDPGTYGRPDSENNNRGQSINLKNNYFSYKLDLSSSRFYVEGSDLNGWRSYRIPLRDAEALDHVIGSPNWQVIDYVRIWVEAPDQQPFTVFIAAIDLIQSNWEDTVIYADSLNSTTTFNVAVINNQENSAIYTSPPGVEGYYDQSTQTREPEQSLLLHFDSLAFGDICLAERILFESNNYMGYGSLKMFVNTPTEDLPENAVVYSFRLGQDRNNYYAYQDTLHPGDPTNRWLLNEVNMNFNDITALKEYMLQDRMHHPEVRKDTVSGNYRVVGNPTLTQVKYLAMSVMNIDSTKAPTGDIWFDELQLGGVRRDVGIAFRASANGNVADLFNYSAAYSHKNPFFRGISTSTRGGSSDNLGSGKSSTSYNYSISMSLDRFLPKSLGAKIPLSLRYSRSLDVPQLRYNTDIVLPQELRHDERTESVSKGLTVSEGFNKNTKNPLYTVLLNKLKTSFSYNRSESRSPSSPMSLGESYNLKGQYGFNISKVPHLRPFFWTKPVPMLKRLDPTKFYLFPGTWSFDGTFNRNFRVSENTSNIKTSSLQRDFFGRMAITYRISDNLSGNYSMDTKRDLYDSDLIKFSFNPKNFKFGRETSYNQNLNLTYSPTLYQFLTHKFSYGFSYRENLNVRDSTYDVGASKNYGVSGNLDLQKLFVSGKKRGSSTSSGSDRHRAKPAGTTEEGQPLLSRVAGPLAKVMGRLTGWINPIGYDYNERYNYTYVGLMGRASWPYRLGFTENTGVGTRADASSIGKSNAINKNTAYSLRSGTDLFGGLKLDVTYSRKINEDIEKSVNPQKSISTTFPDIRFSIKPMRTFRLFNPLIKKFQPRTAYTRSTSENFNLSTGQKTQETITIGQRPLLAFSFNLLRGMQINFSTDHSVTETKNLSLGNKTKTINNTMRVSTSYSFSAPTGFKFPVFGRLKFKSTMSLSVDVSMQNDRTETANMGFPYAPSGERTNLTIAPTVSYSFSSQIKGGLTGRWQDTNDKIQGRKTYTRELRIYVDIRF